MNEDHPSTYEELAASGSSPIEMIAEFEKWDALRRRLEDELKVAKGAMKKFQEPLKSFFVNNAMTKIEVRGRPVRVKSKWRGFPAEGKTSADVCRALRDTGYSDLVNEESYHWSRISSLVKEFKDGKKDVPPELAGVLDMRQEFTVVVDK